jgi:hypothetical protein
VASLDFECHAIDMKNAFIQGSLEEEVFMKQPPGIDDQSGLVCRLNKSLYGFKQAPRVWNQTLSEFVISLGFIRSTSDGALFILSSPELGVVLMLIYVDDIQIASAKLTSVTAIKVALLSKFPGKDLGETKFLLQMSVVRDRANRVLVMKQQRHIETLLEQSGLQDAWPMSIPMMVKVHQDPAGELVQDSAAIMQYKSLVGALLHLANYTRPDIAFAVSYLARYSASPTTGKFARLKDVLLYLKGTISYGLLLGGASCALHAFCDSDYADCTLSRRSTTGFLVECGVGTVVTCM